MSLFYSVSSSQPSIFNQPTPNGPYTLLKIYSYNLHCQSGLGRWAQRDRREGRPLSCSLRSHFCTQTQHYPRAKTAGSKGLEGPAGWVGRGRGAQRGPASPGPVGTHGRRWIWCLHLSIYRYLQKKVMSNRPQSCRRNAPPSHPPKLATGPPQNPEMPTPPTVQAPSPRF